MTEPDRERAEDAAGRVILELIDRKKNPARPAPEPVADDGWDEDYAEEVRQAKAAYAAREAERRAEEPPLVEQTGAHVDGAGAYRQTTTNPQEAFFDALLGRRR